MAKLKQNRRIRATFSAIQFGSDRLGAIDKEAGVLHDVQICLEGEAKGHDVFLGSDFIQDVAKAGNEFKMGVKVRFGHPAMCSDALGTYLGRAKNFRTQEITRTNGEKALGCFADIELAEESRSAPSGDLYTWTLETAEKSPDTFGQSIVFTVKDYYFIDDSGKKIYWNENRDWAEQRDKASDRRIFCVMDKLLGTDFTDTPAATDGVFSSDSLAAEAEQMLDDHPSIMAVLTDKPDTVNQFLERFNEELAAAGKKKLALITADDQESLAQESKKSSEKIEELTAALKEKEDSLAKISESLKTAKSELAEALSKYESEKAARLKVVGAALAPAISSGEFSSWEAANEKLGYVKARNQYPDLYRAFMNKYKDKE